MPATPPARNAIVSALRRPDSFAALAVRTFARTASHIPAYPVSIEAPAPNRNATERPTRIDSSGDMPSNEVVTASETGNTKNSATVRMPRNTPSVLNCRFR